MEEPKEIEKKFKFTDTKISAIEFSPKIVTYRDTEVRGLILVVSASRKVFRLEKHIPALSKTKSIRIGLFDPYSHNSTENLNTVLARKIAREMLAKIDQGKDPSAGKESSLSLREVRDAYVKDGLASKRLKPETAQSKYVYDFDLYAKGLLDLPIIEVTSKNIEKEIRKLLEEKPERHTSLGIFLRSLSAVLNYANARFSTEVTRVFIENPVLAVRRMKFLKRSKPRARVLYEHELPIFYNFLHSRSSFSAKPGFKALSVTADFMIFVLFSGARRGEASRLQWKDVYTDYVIFRGTKTGDDRQVPMPEILLELLERRRRIAPEGSLWVFPSPNPLKPICEPKNLINRFLGYHADFPAFCVHDLRRTFSTYAKMTVPSVLVSQLTGHKERRGTEETHYSSFTPQHLREGMEKIADILLSKTKAEV